MSAFRAARGHHFRVGGQISRLALPTALALVLLTNGCAPLFDQMSDVPPVVAELEAFNRTESDIVYLAADGERLDVPACGSATDATFRIDRVEVRTVNGYVRTFGVAAPEFARRHLVVVEVSSAMDSGVPEPVPPPDPLPPCDGQPEVQAGI